MELKIGSKIHNRFDIEVRDFKTGELRQKGQAENIILNRIYTRLCNFNSYFDYIHFGQGIGVLDSSRIILFDELGYKAATTEEIVKDSPISRWTRKIVLSPEEYVGKSIKEVGISDTYSSNKSSSYINTHALIKDAEGNQLSIEKTGTDVVIIYATVFIELENNNSNVRFTELPSNNVLLSYLTGASFSNPSIQVGESNKLNLTSIAMLIAQKSSTRTVNTANRTSKFSTRFGITEGNGNIAEIGLAGVCAGKIPSSEVFQSYALRDVQIGIGDGTTTQYIVPGYNIESLQISVDGTSTQSYQITKEDHVAYVRIPIQTYLPRTTLTPTGKHLFVYTTNSGGLSCTIYVYFLPEDTDGLVLLRTLGFSSFSSSIESSEDGSYIKVPIKDDTRYYKIVGDTSLQSINAGDLPSNIVFQRYESVGKRSLVTFGNYDIRISTVLGQTSKVQFNSPPTTDKIITADYTVPYIPKTEDYVLDVNCEIQFGEGV